MTPPGHHFRAGYVRRIVDDELDVLLASLPAILLDGTKAVGKTKSAQQRATTTWRLNRAADAQVVEADVAAALSRPTPILLDEYQRSPGLWDDVKDAVDSNLTAGQFILTGSAPPPGNHSGAGRIPSVSMRPLTLPERGVCVPTVRLADLVTGKASITGTSSLGLEDYTDLILASGFPGFQHLDGRALTTQLEGYLTRIVDHDVAEEGLSVRRPATLMAWLRAYAAAESTTTTWEKIRDAASSGHRTPARTTTLRYTDTLTRLRVLDELPAWSPSKNHLQRLTLAAKHHLADPALSARLLGATRASLLRGEGEKFTPNDGTYLGQLFEALVTLSVRVFASASHAAVSHLRQSSGRHEVDLIVEWGDERDVVAFEVKLSASVDDRDVQHLLWLREQLGDRLRDAAVVTTGTTAYRRRDGIAVIPLALLGP